MVMTFDCIVLGVGGFGSGALYHLARRGLKVLGLEQFSAAHDRGSSHGETRIIRQAYFEHPDYVPLLLRAYELWDELEAESGASLCRLCGLMLCGPADGEAIPGALLSASRYGVPVEEIPPGEATKRFPGFAFPEGSAIVFEPRAGYLHVERCVAAHIERARAHGAAFHAEETVRDWQATERGVRVRTDRNEYSAGALVITAGAWAARVLADLSLPLTIVRKPVLWFPSGGAYQVEQGAPTFYYETPQGAFYGFPSLDGRTVKTAEHTGGRIVDDPALVDRELRRDDTEPVAAFLKACLPEVQAEPVRHSVCLYTRTPDHHFIVDRHPAFPQVVFGAGFSGHGFKFTSVLGVALADLAAEGSTRLPIGFLGLERASLQNR